MGSIQNDIGLLIPIDCSDSSTLGILPAVKASNVLVVDVASTIWVKFFTNIIYVNCVKLHCTSPNIRKTVAKSVLLRLSSSCVYTLKFCLLITGQCYVHKYSMMRFNLSVSLLCINSCFSIVLHIVNCINHVLFKQIHLIFLRPSFRITQVDINVHTISAILFSQCN